MASKRSLNGQHAARRGCRPSCEIECPASDHQTVSEWSAYGQLTVTTRPESGSAANEPQWAPIVQLTVTIWPANGHNSPR